VDEEAHEEHQGAEVVSVLVEEGAVEVGAFQEVVAAVSLHEEEVVREVVSHGVVVDYIIPCVLQSHLCRYSGVLGLAYQVFKESKNWSNSSLYMRSLDRWRLDHGIEGCLQREHFNSLKPF
jgi:hypothetical protein